MVATMVDRSDLELAMARYLDAFPFDRGRLSAVEEWLASGVGVLHTDSASCHLTASCAIIDDSRRVLVIRHSVIGLWLLPGGHVELADTSIEEGALRELAEETGISSQLIPVDGSALIDVDVHEVRDRRGTAHVHVDFRFGYRIWGSPSLRVDPTEVDEYRWVDVLERPLRRVSTRLAALGGE